MLLKLVPGLEERIVNGSDEETMRIAELVNPLYFFSGRPLNPNSLSFRRVRQARDLTTQKA